MSQIIYFLISAAIAYLLGSILSAKLVCKVTDKPDPSTQGSGNPGATNVLRFAGKKSALITLSGDVLKGLLAVIIGRAFGVEGFLLGLVGLAAFVGHLYPLYFNFKGGKGVSVSLGVLIGLSPLVGILALITWIVVAAFTRYSSLSALIAATASLVYALFLSTPAYLLPILIMVGLLVWRHYGNIQRLLDGTEDKMSVDLKVVGKDLWEKGKSQVEAVQKKRAETKTETPKVSEEKPKKAAPKKTTTKTAK
jgi:glycerol-3-phosphate acyltransferase PlsY